MNQSTAQAEAVKDGVLVGAGPALADTALRRAIDDTLEQRRYQLLLAPRLEQEYESSTGSGRNRRISRGLLILAAIQAFCTVIDALTVPQLIRTTMLLRWGFIVPLCLVCAWLLIRRTPAWLHNIAVTAPFACQVAGVTLIGEFAPAPFSDRYLMAAGISIGLINVLITLRFREALWQSALSLMAYAGVLLGGIGPKPIDAVLDLVLFMTMMTAGSLVAMHRLESGQKRIFVLRLRDELRALELQDANEQLKALTLRDALTGVGNRRSFDLALERLWESAVLRRAPLALLMVDVDHFKAYNDTLGHAEGDQCLRAIARALHANIRSGNDLVTRYGGEEFAVILADASADAAQATAERMRAAIEQLRIPHPGLRNGSCVTVSIGVATALCSDHDTASRHLLQAADSALYEAKHLGRNRVTVYSDAGRPVRAAVSF